jgi:hypothetical protein
VKTDSNNDQLEPEDIVWNKITDSAKRRIDYPALVESFEEVGDPVLPEIILFQIILGRAVGEDKETIASKLESQLMVLGIGAENGTFLELVEEIEPAVSKEVLAASMALALFQEGNDPIDVLVTVSQLL